MIPYFHFYSLEITKLLILRKYSEKLTTGNFDNFVKTQVDSGKTLLVRWIASSG